MAGDGQQHGRERTGITAFLKRIDQSEHMFYHSIGTVGGGNHFVVVGITPDGNYAFTAHCGSRNLGQKEVDYFIKPVINLKATCSYDSSVEIDINEEQD